MFVCDSSILHEVCQRYNKLPREKSHNELRLGLAALDHDCFFGGFEVVAQQTWTNDQRDGRGHGCDTGGRTKNAT